ncbi:FHA domain-containing protein [Salinibacterium sp. PAMC 21357]|uniref:FHA domain-containing protein n=1 Tax=Salinibacterium sp. PAMC 21357 TaxID=1112215 RepID=UPI000289F84B|nr:FHA domain-containing protein [Salinibacterium sp. PAMC 21357]
MFSYSLAPQGTPGFAAITDRFVALVAGVDISAASELYEFMAGPDATIDDLLDAVSARNIPTFAIVELLTASPVAVAIAASGSARVDIDGAASTTIAGPPGATWVIGKAREIRSIVMSLGGEPGSPARLPIARGVVPADSILIDESHASAPIRKAPAHPATMPIVLPQLSTPSEPTPQRSARSAESPAAESLAAPSLATPAPAAPDASSDASSAPSSSDLLVIELPDGNRLDPRTPVLVGRRPWNNATEDASRFHVTAESPERQISARHLLLTATEGQVIAQDFNSTNGTVVIRFGRPPWLLHEGSTTVLLAGDTLDLGESYRVSIVRSSAATELSSRTAMLMNSLNNPKDI